MGEGGGVISFLSIYIIPCICFSLNNNDLDLIGLVGPSG
jgi:hypothetical protein